MDPSYRPPLEPPKDWAKAYYKKPPPGKFYRFINIRNETFLAYFLIITCTGLFWYPLVKPAFQSIHRLWKHPEILRYEWEHLFKSSLTDEQKLEIRRTGGMNVHRLSDIWENAPNIRWERPTDEGQMTDLDRAMKRAAMTTLPVVAEPPKGESAPNSEKK